MLIIVKDGNKYSEQIINSRDDSIIYKGIEITNKKGSFFISLKKGFFFDNQDKVRRLVPKHYVIKQKGLFNDIELFVYENENGINDYTIYNNQPFILAASEKANIRCLDPYLANAFLYYNDGQLKTNSSFLLVNGKNYENQKLDEGDEIRFLSFKFVFNKDFIYSNNFLIDNRLKRKEVVESVIRYENKKVKENNIFTPERNELIIEKIKEYNPIKPVQQRKLIFQIGPSITMSLTMVGIAAINVYNSYINNQPLLNSLVYIMMPVTMLLSGVLWPVIISASENRSNKKKYKEDKDKYLDYLLSYESNLVKAIDKYRKEENSYYFNGNVDENKLFYITHRHSMFLLLSIGKTTCRKSIQIPVVDDEQICEALNRIAYRLNNIEDFPLFIDLKKYKAISIVTKKSKKIDTVKRIMLELSSKNHYDDFYLAIYSEDLNPFSDFYSLPQLMFGSLRLTLNRKRELQELNSLKLDKPLILLLNDKSDYIFTNNEIHVLYFTSDIKRIYRDSEVLIEYQDNEGYCYEKEKTEFTYKEPDVSYKDVVSLLGPYQKVSFLSRTITFKDVYHDFDIAKYYSEKQNGLRADFATVGNEILSFDLHESRQGPHGLIGGSTGSGKSELIVSLLLSLCIRYRPDYLNIILIDYKGGGIEESLSYMGKRVPHIIASIDNLEQDIFERLIVAVDFECKRRQKLFKTLSNKAMTSIMNIDDYLNGGYKTYNLPAIAHLLIVVDEFAELKKENPEIIRELISFSRIGRSLGVHLILATQRPSGVIDDEIWSNSHFKIALKVFSEKDSNDIIKNKEAAFLNNPGEFYLAVDDNLIKARSIYSKKDINNGEAYEVALLDNRLETVKKKSVKKEVPFTEASFIVKKINEYSLSKEISNSKLSFSRPEALFIDDLTRKYSIKSGLVLGESDDYLKAENNPVIADEEKSVFIFSTRNKEINGVLNSLNSNAIVIGSRKYESSFISDSLLYEESEDIDFLFKSLLKDSVNRTLVIEDLSCFLSYSELYQNYLFQLLRRQSTIRIRIIAISKQSSISFKLLNCFNQKYAVEINDNQDLINVFSSGSKYKGKSFFFDEQLISFIPCKEEEFKCEKSEQFPYVKHIPEVIHYSKQNSGLLLGYDVIDRKEIRIKNNDRVTICSYDDNVIEKYKELFKDDSNIEAMIYDRSMIKDEKNKYIWIGEGLFNQKLFYPDVKDELKENEAYYFKGNKGIIMRFVDSE